MILDDKSILKAAMVAKLKCDIKALRMGIIPKMDIENKIYILLIRNGIRL
jgi:hypothetical protein